MNGLSFITFSTTVALSALTYALPVEAPAKVEVIPSSISLEGHQEKTFFNEPICRSASIGISTNFGSQESGVIISKEGIIVRDSRITSHAVTKKSVEQALERIKKVK